MHGMPRDCSSLCSTSEEIARSELIGQYLKDRSKEREEPPWSSDDVIHDRMRSHVSLELVFCSCTTRNTPVSLRDTWICPGYPGNKYMRRNYPAYNPPHLRRLRPSAVVGFSTQGPGAKNLVKGRMMPTDSRGRKCNNS